MREGGFTAYSGLSARVPPDHTRIRKLVQGCFGPRRFRAIEPEIKAIVNRVIDTFAERGHADFFRELAYDVPALVLFKLVGIPNIDVPRVKSWAVSRALLTWPASNRLDRKRKNDCRKTNSRPQQPLR